MKASGGGGGGERGGAWVDFRNWMGEIKNRERRGRGKGEIGTSKAEILISEEEANDLFRC